MYQQFVAAELVAAAIQADRRREARHAALIRELRGTRPSLLARLRSRSVRVERGRRVERSGAARQTGTSTL
jgi:hypothetical protein